MSSERSKGSRSMNSKKEIGAERVSQNGYTYVKVGEGQWRLKHHIIAEHTLGRPLRADERVYFKDGDKTNLKAYNIAIMPKGSGSLRKRRAVLESKIEELQAELTDVNRALKLIEK